MALPGIPLDGAKLQQAREARRLSPGQLASLVGCTTHHLRYIERGIRYPSIELLGRLEEALDTTAENLGASAPPRRQPH